MEEYSETCGIILYKESKGEMGINNRENRELARLCAQASLTELHSLVEELHRRRAENGIDLADYELQGRLKALIYSIHRYGNLAKGERKVNRGLLELLKRASAKLEVLKPTGLLRELLRNFSASWPELMTMFWALLAMPGMDKLLGKDLQAAQNYLQFNRFLYFLFLTRLAQLRQGPRRPERFLFDDGEMRGMIRGQPELTRAYRELRNGHSSDWSGRIPLLPVRSGQWLLSPELLYDDLLENYAEVMGAYAHRSEQSLVAEARDKRPWPNNS